MKRTNCIICKKKPEQPFKEPLIEKQKYPVCSKECFNVYLICWNDEDNFPENLNNVRDLLNSQQTKPKLPDGNSFRGNSLEVTDKTADTYTKEQIEEFPDY